MFYYFAVVYLTEFGITITGIYMRPTLILKGLKQNRSVFIYQENL